MKHLTTLICCGALVACGGFENRRFEEGEGGVQGTTAPGASVFVVDHADLATTADEAGGFSITGAPAGALTLLVSAPKAAALREVRVVADWTADAGAIEVEPAGILTGLAPPGVTVWVPGTSLFARTGDDGRWVLSGVPATGCVPLTAPGAAGALGCPGAGTEPDLTDADPTHACLGVADCPVGVPCEAGSCQLPAADAAPDPDPGVDPDPDVAPDPDDPPADDPAPTPRGCDGADDLGASCGPPGLCGDGGVLECDADGVVVCSIPDADPLECGGYGDVYVVDELSIGEGQGFDLDNDDGDDDPTTGRDNALSTLSMLLRLLDRPLANALDLDDGEVGRYLVDVRSDRLRIYVGVESEAAGVYEPRWSLLGDEGLPLGDLPLLGGPAGVLAGPAPIDLAIAIADRRLPFPLRRSYLGIDAAAGVGDIGAAVNISSLLGFVEDIEDRALRNFLEDVLSPGDLDTDGDGHADSLSLALRLQISPATLR